MDKMTILNNYFGYSSFRRGQGDVVDAILSGRDVLAIMPTGAGKSLCYQVPSLMMSGTTLVISPLISLMKDQVKALIANGVKAAYLNSSLQPRHQRRVMEKLAAGDYDLLYIAPERLMDAHFIRVCHAIAIPLVAIDEAHCISQWGQDFRPSYLAIVDFVAQLPTRPIVAAFTATATPEIKDDIAACLKLKCPFAITTGFDRPNLHFAVQRPVDKDAALLNNLKDRRNQSGIVYCLTRKTVEQVEQLLCAQGYRATRYHAGLSDEERRDNQEAFSSDTSTIMVATNAFGMGIDKSNVSFVIHYQMPKNLESYYQEAGRAGRDGAPADCLLLFAANDIRLNRFIIEKSGESDDDIVVDKTRELERLKTMEYYCKTTDCLRGFLLDYFGEAHGESCGNCSNCHGKTTPADYTIDTQKILSCIYKTRQRYGTTTIVDILRGSKKKRLLQLSLDKQSTYGIMRDLTTKRMRQIIDQLLLAKYLSIADCEFPVLKLTQRGYAILKGRGRVMLRLPTAETGTLNTRPLPYDEDVDQTLLQKLKALRHQLASEQGIPAYIVFSNASLLDMCRKKPIKDNDFLSVSGVGHVKLERYGAAFMTLIQAHRTV